MNRLRKQIYPSQPLSKSSIKGGVVDARVLGPFGQCFCLVAIPIANISSVVVALNLMRGPAAILWRVRAIIVDTIDFVKLGWSRTHVGVESFERVPPHTDLDAASPIVPVDIEIRVDASLPHAMPNTVLGGPGHSVFFARHASELLYVGGLPTSARLRMPRSEMVTSRNRCIPAIAQASPFARLVSFLNHGEIAETLSGKVRFHGGIVTWA